jgi:hypothetical protein
MENSIKHAKNLIPGGIVIKMSKLEIHLVEGGFLTNRQGR